MQNKHPNSSPALWARRAGKAAQEHLLGLSKSLRKLMVMLGLLLLGTPAMALTHTPSVEYFTNRTMMPNGDCHVGLLWYFFNYDGGADNGYVNDVYLTIDGIDAVKLNEAYDKCTNNRGSEDRVKGKSGQGMWGKVLTASYGNNGNKVTVMFHDQWEGDNKWIKIRLNVILHNLYDGKSHKIGIRGNWKDKDNNGGELTIYPKENGSEVSLNAPNFVFPALSASNIKRTGNGVAQVDFANLLADTRTVKSYTYNWLYSFDFYKTQQANGTDPGYGTYTQLDTSNGVTVSGTHSTTTASATAATVDLKVDNYQTQTIYARVGRYTSPDYRTWTTNSSSYAEGTVTAYKYYPAITLKGYPRPNPSGQGNPASTAAGAMKTVYDPYSKSVKVTWSIEVFDQNNVDRQGKWVIFRAEDEKGTNRVRLGEVSASSTSFVDNDETNHPKEYDKTYRYTVCFQPDAWNTTIQSEAEALGLSFYVDQEISRSEDVFTSLTASQDKTSQIDVAWSFNSFADASAAKKYTINLYKGLVTVDAKGKETTTWESSATYTQTISDPSTTTGAYTHTGISSKYLTYNYRIEVNAQGKLYTRDGAKGKLDGTTKIETLTASRGSFANTVIVNWTSQRVGAADTYYELRRRPLGTNMPWQTIYTIASTATSFTYEDKSTQPGNYYEYRVECYEYYEEGNVTKKMAGTGMETDGFSLSTGVVNGRVYYGTGTSVEGVRVSALPASEDGSVKSAFHSFAYGDATKSGLIYQTDNEEIRTLLGKSFSMQLWVKPDANKMSAANTNYFLVDIACLQTLYGRKTTAQIDGVETPMLRLCYVNSGQKFESTDLLIPYDKWSFVTASYDHTTGVTTLYVGQTPTDLKAFTIAKRVNLDHAPAAETDAVVIGSWKSCVKGETTAGSSHFIGGLDEFRFFTRALSRTDIERNMSHRLAGSEESLAIYYPMDEGINGQTVVYDYSKTSGNLNGRHASVSAVKPSDDVPDNVLFSLSAYTTKDGNYSITGIPFSGDGTAYSITPTMGVHEFSPSKLNRFISTSSLVADGVDFLDVSSFSVKGTVYYDGTTYPVEGVEFKVDGAICTNEDGVIRSSADGKFEISVPIGFHTITASLDGHTFKYNGRYPDPEVANSYEFTKDMTGLHFFDTTLVPVAGRITGGPLEYAKALGFGESVNNLGTAVLTLKPSSTYRMNVDEVSYEGASQFVEAANDRVYDIPAEFRRNYDEAGKDVKCSARVGSQTVDATQTITITTDSLTGEWAAMLPPVPYTVTSIALKRDASVNLIGEKGTTFVIDASNVQKTTTDSIAVQTTRGEVFKYFKYNAALNREYRVEPTMHVQQRSAAEGAFGEARYETRNTKGDVIGLDLYDAEGDFTVVPNRSQDKTNDAYAFDYPVFYQGNPYDFDILLYEEYENVDNHQKSKVYLPNVVITIGNEMGSDNVVALRAANGDTDYQGQVLTDGSIIELADNQVVTDEGGAATYSWNAGAPCIQEPYTRSMTITYDIDGTMKSWDGSGLTGIVFGSLPTGNNFVTSGPDKVIFILRDPPGTGSSASIEEGYTVSHEIEVGAKLTNENEVTTETKFGTELAAFTGQTTPSGSIAGKITEASSKATLEVGLNVSIESTVTGTITEEVTTTKSVSTSDGSDFVGAVGDVFIGTATNYVFGKCRTVGLQLNAQENGFGDVSFDEGYQVGTSFGTEFHYTQNYVEGTLIPNFEALRNQLLIHVDSYDEIEDNYGDAPKYYTTLDEDDDNFGSNNNDAGVWGKKAMSLKYIRKTADDTEYFDAPSYVMVMPNGYETSAIVYEDSIAWYNAQIKAWQNTLMANEKAKVEAIQDRATWLDHNYSFDAGASIEASLSNKSGNSTSVESEITTTIVAGAGTEVKILGQEVEVKMQTSVGAGVVNNTSSGSEKETTISYTLAEDGDDDALSVDVFKAPDGYGPIFYTQAGQTCCPWEDEVTTHYYQPGTVISKKTMQIEQPHITADVTKVTGVPVGGAANFVVTLSNTSETDEDCYFNIQVVSSSNTYGAAVTMDGTDLNYGHTVLVKAGQEMRKHVQISQTNEDITEMNDIELRLFSVCQPDDTGVFPAIADTVRLSASFQLRSCEVAMTTAESALNIATGSALHTTIRGYDINSTGLVGVRLETQRAGDTGWRIEKTWRKDGKGEDPLSTDGHFDYVLDMSNAQIYPDGIWNVRAVTFSNFGGVEDTYPSEITTFSKDMVRPQLITAATPSNGILTADSEISLTFNENIRQAEIAEADNFIVNAELNDATVSHNVAMNLTGADGAKTESSIALAGQSFAINTWLRYSAPGSIFSHGVSGNAFDVSVNAADKLVVTVGDKTITSTQTLERGKWMFLSVSYDAEKEAVYADYAYDAFERNLFNAQPVGPYTGNGAVTLGQGLMGQMHEVTLWNNARSWREAQPEMYTRKSRYTDGLMGYWRLDEGHGTVAIDQSRSRTLTLPAAGAWYTVGDNYALTLSGSQVAAINCGFATDPQESYTMELWFNADKSQTTEAGIVGFNTADKLDIYMDAAGKLKMRAEGVDYDLGASAYRDGQWHHLALNALKSTKGSATVYVDGKAVKSIAVNLVPQFATSKLVLGGRRTDTSYGSPLKGAIDEVRVWSGRRTADVINNNMYQRVDEISEGLLAYYPFERITIDSGDQATTVTTFADMTGLEKNALSLILGGGSPASSKANTPALKTAPALQNVAFNFVASERKLLITLAENPELLENCIVHLTVKGIRDEHDNMCENIAWDVLVRQNQLRWADSDIAVQKEGTRPTTFKAVIENNGATPDDWTISGMPEWLTANAESGSLSGAAQRELTFTVAPSLAIGNYETTLYLRGKLGINEPLVVRVASMGNVPEWVATDDENTMNVIGQVVVDDVFSTDENDILAAFRTEADGRQTCIGVAHPKYYSRYDKYLVLIDVYGNGNTENSPVSYKFYDASTGTVYASVTTSNTAAEKFISENMVGGFNTPVIFTAENKIEQEIALAKAGWKWFSMFVTPDKNTVADVFDLAGGPVSVVKNDQYSASLIGGSWVGSLTKFEPNCMYKLSATDSFGKTICGTPVQPSDVLIRLDAQGWNWIGYPATASNSLEAALADAAPREGDIVKGQKFFSTYSNGEWVGSLLALTPGEGYYYYSTATGAKNFHMATPVSTGRQNVQQRVSADMIDADYRDNMTMIAEVRYDDFPVEDAVISIYQQDGELCGFSSTNIDGRHFVTIGGNTDGDALTIYVDVEGQTYRLNTPLRFCADTMLGTMDAPYCLSIEGGYTTVVDGVHTARQIANVRYFDAQGRQVDEKAINAETGVYLKQTTYTDGSVQCTMVKPSQTPNL